MLKNMKIQTLSLLVAAILTSCIANNIENTRYYPIKGGPDYSMTVPQGFIFDWFNAGMENEYRYTYADSSFIFITSFENSPNYENIREQGSYHLRFVLSKDDTLTLTGVDNNGLFWKDKAIGGGIFIGYRGVPKITKNMFDSSLTTIRKNN